jgi:hypothetical protein
VLTGGVASADRETAGGKGGNDKGGNDKGDNGKGPGRTPLQVGAPAFRGEPLRETGREEEVSGVRERIETSVRRAEETGKE